MAFLGGVSTDAQFSKLKDGITVSNGNIEDEDNNVIYNNKNSHVPTTILQDDSLTISGGNGISGAGSVSLGGSNSISVDASDFISTSPDGVSANIGNGLIGDGSNNISIDESFSPNWTGRHVFEGGIEFGSLVLPTDLGNFNFINAEVTSDVVDGNEQSYSFDINGTSVLTVFSIADGAGGIKDKAIKLNGSIKTKDGQTIFDETNTHVPESALQTLSNSALTNSSISINGSSVALGGSTTINVDLGDDEKRLFGANQDVSLRFDSANDSFIIQDNINVNDILNVDRSTGDVDISGELTEGAAL
jgi:hypothetical protein